MKTLNESFTDQEFELLKAKKGKLSWHKFIMTLVSVNDVTDYMIVDWKEKPT